MGIFDKIKINKSLNSSISQVDSREEHLKEHESYLNDLKVLLDNLSEFDKKYVHLCPILGEPKMENGSIDYSKMSTEYRRYLLNFRETLYPIQHYSRIPRMIKDISKSVSKDSRRLDKKDFLMIREVINNQLDELESLCSVDYDYESGSQEAILKSDKMLEGIDKELTEVENLRTSSVFE